MDDTSAPPRVDGVFTPFALRGRTVLITGGNRGIGAAVAVAAAAAGADIALGYLDREQDAGNVVHQVEALGRQCMAQSADIADGDAARGLVRDAERRFGRIDGLVNNAGIMPSSPFLEMTATEWDTVIRTNLTSAFHTCQAAIPGMLERGGGAIVNVASRLGQVGWAGVPHYAAAKAGLIALTKSLAREFGQQGIRTNAVAPGVTNTEMGRTVMEGEVGRRRMAELPLGRFAEPSDVAGAVVFLLSDASAAFIGQTLNPNCGGYMP